MLRVECLFTSATRLQVRARPEGYSRPLFDTMANANSAMRQRCARHLDELYNDTRTMAFRLLVNGSSLRDTPVSDWPSSWDSFDYGFTVFPLRAHGDKVGLLDEGYEWLVAAFRPLFDLLEVSIEYDGYAEGDAQRVLSTKYERNRRNRDLCIAAQGACCVICGFDFGKAYGPMGEGYIHVHHVVPISKLGPGYVIDPVRDLVPVCPNCHAMLHRFDPPLEPSVLRQILAQTRTRRIDSQ
jgi:5-methylcytosine-specific restriction protein A